MTIQTPDTVVHGITHYILICSQGEELFSPEKLGITPFSRSTDCWRGYVITYTILARQLFLERVRINLREKMPLYNIKPEEDSEFSWDYNHIHKPLSFTGKLLLGENRSEEPFNYSDLTSYAILIGLTFQAGKNIKSTDLSKKKEKLNKDNRRMKWS